MKLLLFVAIVVVLGSGLLDDAVAEDAGWMHAEHECWKMSKCKSPPQVKESAEVNCYAYEKSCSPEVTFGFVSIAKGVKAPTCGKYFDCLLERVQFCHKGLCRREGVEPHHCERKLRDTKCFTSRGLIDYYEE